jgi:hypothetical protein
MVSVTAAGGGTSPVQGSGGRHLGQIPRPQYIAVTGVNYIPRLPYSVKLHATCSEHKAWTVFLCQFLSQGMLTEQTARMASKVDLENELRVERRQQLQVRQFSVRSFRRTAQSDFLSAVQAPERCSVCSSTVSTPFAVGRPGPSFFGRSTHGDLSPAGGCGGPVK